jgi:hypothetical protein
MSRFSRLYGVPAGDTLTETKIARVSTGSAAQGEPNSAGSLDSHPSWRPPAMGVLSGIEGSALCGAAFPHVAGERQARRDAFLTRRSKRCRQIRLRSSGAPGRPSGAPSWRHPDRPAGLTRSRIRSWAPPKTCTNCLRSPRRVGRCGQAGDGGVEDELVPGEFLEERGPP